MLAELQAKARLFADANASALLTAGGVVGTVGTAIFTARASFKAGKIVAEANYDRLNGDEDEVDLITTREAIPMVWPLFLTPVGLAGATVVSIILANRVDAKKAAALAAAYGLVERDFEEYKAKALEKLGINKEQKLRDEIAQDRVSNNPDSQTIIIGGSEVLCYDMLTGRYFKSTVEDIKKAENLLNQALFNHNYASLSEFYENVGLEPTKYTEEVGWNQIQDGNLEVRITTTMSTDGRPCLAVDFTVAPHPDYAREY